MANRLLRILLGISLFQAFNLSPCRAALSPMMQSGVQGRSAPSDDSSGQSPTSAKPTRSGSAKVDSELPPPNEFQNSVRITGLPPVAIQDKQKAMKDYLFEWSSWAFNLLLVVVGGLQVLLLRQTRQEMSLQRDQMSLQKEEMSLQRQEMAGQRQLMSQQTRMMSERERAKLVVLFPPDKLVFGDLPNLNAEDRVEIKGLAVRIANFGYTEARKVDARGDVVIDYNKSDSVPILKHLNMATVVPRMASSETVETTEPVLLDLIAAGSMTVTQETMDQLLNGEVHLRLVGSITYIDLFENAHENSFAFFWVVKKISEKGKIIDKSFWHLESNEAT